MFSFSNDKAEKIQGYLNNAHCFCLLVLCSFWEGGTGAGMRKDVSQSSYLVPFHKVKIEEFLKLKLLKGAYSVVTLT